MEIILFEILSHNPGKSHHGISSNSIKYLKIALADKCIGLHEFAKHRKMTKL